MKTTFWNLLNSKGIVIPIIQRDYAQGRSGEKYQHIRENFLKQIGKVIDVLPMDEGEEASNSMDFIYGMEDMNPINGKNSIYPIDGQQRLTALWLIHWYVAFKAKKTDLSQFTEAEKKRINDPSDKLDDLSPEKKEIVETIKKLKKFSYETRTSSREFCQNLCDLKGAEKQSETGIVQFIKNQTWFLSVWEQDPTIKAMLNMLEGEKDGMKDGIEKLFAKCDDYIGCWDRLTCNKCSVCNCDKCTKTISFHYLPMNLAGKNSEGDIRPNSEEHVSEDSLQLSDDLYIKMNARGKALTSFENFKAHYISWLQKEKSEDWIKIASKIDIEWTNIFWQIKGDKENVDKLYFTFINRYLWTHTFILTDYEGKYIIREQYKRFSDATSDEYNDFTLYAKLFKTNSLTNSLEKTLDNISKYYTTNKNNEIKELFPAWVQQKKSFLLEYDDSEYSEKQLIVFFGICKYFENQRFEKESFTDWIRVVWNLVENWTTQEACIRLLNVLSKHSDSILNYLHRIINIEDCEELKIYKDNKQLQEEIVKANQMIHGKIEDLPSIPEDWDNSKEWNWATAIIEAEKSAFFKGAIRFLFTDAEGNMNDWGNFETKLKNTKIFTVDGLSDKKDDMPNRIILSYCTDWLQQIESWTNDNKYILAILLTYGKTTYY